MQKIKQFIKKEPVLCCAVLLAILSAFWVHPDSEYIGYIDFHTLAILFCLMCVMAGLQKLGLFRWIAQRLLNRMHKTSQVVLLLVMLCFFFSMLITNDVALITFVPFTFTVGALLGPETYRRMAFPVVVLQTIAANLGSMLTPVGNPQNLYLYGISGMGTGEFMGVMLPYSLLSLALLAGCCAVLGRNLAGNNEGGRNGKGNNVVSGSGKDDSDKVSGRGKDGDNKGVTGSSNGSGSNMPTEEDSVGFAETAGQKVSVAVYLILFVLCLLTVARLVPLWVSFAAVVAGVCIIDWKVLARVDYCLLLTFVGFFIFIGNMGRIPAFAGLLQKLVAGNEVWVSILASQCISNVPAALLLSGFTDNVRGLLVGVNLGGLGTLIASMASLISYKYIAVEAEKKDLPGGKGRYFKYFTLANLCFLAALVILYVLVGRGM